MDSNSRYYYAVEMYDTETDVVLASVDVEMGREQDIAAAIAEWSGAGKLMMPTAVRVRRMVRLDAPLTEGQLQELEGWIDELEEGSLDGGDDTCMMCGGTGTVTPNDAFVWTGECPICDGEGYYEELTIVDGAGEANPTQVASDTGIPVEKLERLSNNAEGTFTGDDLTALSANGYRWDVEQ